MENKFATTLWMDNDRDKDSQTAKCTVPNVDTIYPPNISTDVTMLTVKV